MNRNSIATFFATMALVTALAALLAVLNLDYRVARMQVINDPTPDRSWRLAPFPEDAEGRDI